MHPGGSCMPFIRWGGSWTTRSRGRLLVSLVACRMSPAVSRTTSWPYNVSLFVFSRQPPSDARSTVTPSGRDGQPFQPDCRLSRIHCFQLGSECGYRIPPGDERESGKRACRCFRRAPIPDSGVGAFTCTFFSPAICKTALAFDKPSPPPVESIRGPRRAWESRSRF